MQSSSSVTGALSEFYAASPTRQACQQSQHRSVAQRLWLSAGRKEKRDNNSRELNFPAVFPANGWAMSTRYLAEENWATKELSMCLECFQFKSKTCVCFLWTLIGRRDKWTPCHGWIKQGPSCFKYARIFWKGQNKTKMLSEQRCVWKGCSAQRWTCLSFFLFIYLLWLFFFFLTIHIRFLWLLIWLFNK